MAVETPPVPRAAVSDACALWRYPKRLPDSLRGGAVALGNFDGIHRGHQAVFSFLKAIEAEIPTGVVSLYPHPLTVLRPAQAPGLLSTVRERYEVIRNLGVSYFYALHFTKHLASISAADFIAQVFVERLGVRHLVVGRDAAIGRGREGNVEYLQRVLPQYGITLHIVPELLIDERRASSREIRRLVSEGDLKGAAMLLGRPVAVTGRVVHGDARGRTIGFPTANLSTAERLLPLCGVYAARVTVEGNVHSAVVNIGTRPTFRGSGQRVEAHLLNYSGGDLYGQRMHIAFIARLRDEQRFTSVEELVVQIQRDCEGALKLLATECCGIDV